MNRTNYLYQKLASIAPTVAQLATVAGSADRWRRKRIVAKCLIAAVAAIMGSSPAMANTMDFKDWTASFGSGKETWTNTSSAGTVTGTSMCPGCWGAPTGTFGVANAIDPPGPITFTTEFNASPNPSSVNFVFSNNYDWGTGGELILGNIHDYFEYSLQAWDFGGNPIDVNTQWTFLNEYLNGAAGQQGYFSTSSTNRCAGGSSLICAGPSTAEDFYVYDTMVDANSGQGGVMVFSGLQNVGRIQLSLLSSSLAQNGQGSDFILFNVGTPVSTPEPASAALVGGAGALLLLLRVRRSRRVA